MSSNKTKNRYLMVLTYCCTFFWGHFAFLFSCTCFLWLLLCKICLITIWEFLWRLHCTNFTVNGIQICPSHAIDSFEHSASRCGLLYGAMTVSNCQNNTSLIKKNQSDTIYNKAKLFLLFFICLWCYFYFSSF